MTAAFILLGFLNAAAAGIAYSQDSRTWGHVLFFAGFTGFFAALKGVGT